MSLQHTEPQAVISPVFGALVCQKFHTITATCPSCSRRRILRGYCARCRSDRREAKRRGYSRESEAHVEALFARVERKRKGWAA